MNAPNFKPEKAAKNPAYLADVRTLPCCICEAFGEEQMSRTTAHHPIHDRFSFAKRPDETAIPLCDGHHQGTFDTSKIAIHRAPEQWREEYGADTDYIATTQDRLGFGREEFTFDGVPCDFPVLDVTPPEPREDPLNIDDGFDANEDKDDLSVMGMR